MERIVYVSTARGKCSHAAVLDILQRSRRNNARDGLSGLLVVGGQRFLQVIEGPSAALERAYTRIKADPRHFALVQIERGAIAERAFPRWNMGYVEAVGASGTTLSGLVEQLTECVADPWLRAHLRSFADLHSRAA
jgi:hypothetical protein